MPLTPRVPFVFDPKIDSIPPPLKLEIRLERRRLVEGLGVLCRLDPLVACETAHFPPLTRRPLLIHVWSHGSSLVVTSNHSLVAKPWVGRGNHRATMGIRCPLNIRQSRRR